MELPHINQALFQILNELPASCQPIAKHVISAGGKRLRPWLTVLFAKLYGYNHNAIYRLACSMELLHAATLLHDDVLDNADKRRGKVAAHISFGSAPAILAGDAMLALGNAIVASFANPLMCQCFSTATSQTAAGEILEIASISNPELSIADYIAIASGKTGYLLAQSCVMGAIAAGVATSSLEASFEFGKNLGIAFQIIDDCLDFSPVTLTGKPAGGDLREKKMTPPIFLYRQSLSETEKMDFDELYQNPAPRKEKLNFYIKAIEPFVEEARNFAAPFISRARDALALLPEGKINKILGQILEKAIQREK